MWPELLSIEFFIIWVAEAVNLVDGNTLVVVAVICHAGSRVRMGVWNTRYRDLGFFYSVLDLRSGPCQEDGRHQSLRCT